MFERALHHAQHAEPQLVFLLHRCGQITLDAFDVTHWWRSPRARVTHACHKDWRTRRLRSVESSPFSVAQDDAKIIGRNHFGKTARFEEGYLSRTCRRASGLRLYRPHSCEIVFARSRGQDHLRRAQENQITKVHSDPG